EDIESARAGQSNTTEAPIPTPTPLASRPDHSGEPDRDEPEDALELDTAELSATEIEDDSFNGEQESEQTEEEEIEPNEGEQAVARAEMRGPSGHQQKVGFDRNRNRGRRGGRRNVRAP